MFADGCVGGVDVATGDTRKGPNVGARILDADAELLRAAPESGEMLVRIDDDRAGVLFGLYSEATGATRIVRGPGS